MKTYNEQIILQDHFDGGLSDGWYWLREHPDYWRIRNRGLEIRVEPGYAETVNNALVRPAPDRSEGRFAIEVTVTNLTYPTQQWEQAGITLYHDGAPVLKEVKELVDGVLCIIPGHVPMSEQTVRLRLIVTNDSWEAQFCPGGQQEFQTAETGKLSPPGKDEVSIQCYHGPPDEAHWIRFENFCIKRLR